MNFSYELTETSRKSIYLNTRTEQSESYAMKWHFKFITMGASLIGKDLVSHLKSLIQESWKLGKLFPNLTKHIYLM